MSNNLISRAALKKYARTVFDKDLGRLRVVDVSDIDNAPTVECFTKEDMSGAYNEGYACGSRESKRPQGEWSEVFEHLGNKYHKCSKCCFGIKLADYDNFCPNCGADMRKGGAV